MRLLRNIISVRSFCLGGVKAAECVKCLRALSSFADTQILCSVLVVWEHVHDAGGELRLPWTEQPVLPSSQLLYWYMQLRSLLSTADEQIRANKD